VVSPQALDDDLPLPEMLALDKPSGNLAVGSVRFRTEDCELDAVMKIYHARVQG